MLGLRLSADQFKDDFSVGLERRHRVLGQRPLHVLKDRAAQRLVGRNRARVKARQLSSMPRLCTCTEPRASKMRAIIFFSMVSCRPAAGGSGLFLLLVEDCVILKKEIEHE